MTPVELSRTVLCAVRRAVDGGELSVAVPARAVVTPPGPGGCGDYATNIALQLARPAGQPPLRVAEILRRHLADTAGLTDVTVTGPGFINISLRDSATSAAALVREILDRGSAYGHSDTLAGQIIRLRIPYDIRAEVVADALTRIIASQGGRTEVEHRKPPTLRPAPTSGGATLPAALAPTLPATPLGPDTPRTETDHREPVDLHPVPAPEDPTPLGPDAARWALLHPAAHDRPRITADHLVQRESNPLFRVRYAYARTRALSRNAADLGLTAEPGDVHISDRVSDHGAGHGTDHGPAHSTDPGSAHSPTTLPTPLLPTPLLTTLADHPRVLAQAAVHRAPDRLARHLVAVADAALPFLLTVLPIGEEKPSAAHRARLALAEAVGAVLAGGLSLLGIDAPEHL
ncbi:ArgS-related anticodon-binding protein NrtL [Streptomyces sp. NPDC005648]|uniref:ArgS-related anticodon-binding protein NrtL n=1 Tax=Streptomyces sp. NPDC005648 TaxID=3157044 RepID=UPI0033ABF3F1